MQCKNHPERRAEHFCASCGIPLCDDCAEEVRPGEHYCFQCAMLHSVSEVGTTIKDKRERAAEKKLGERKKLGPFQYFVIASSVLILVMWVVILFGGQKAPAQLGDFTKNKRVFLFMVDGALKRHAHYEGNRYPAKLEDLIPKYLALSSADAHHLQKLSYQTDPESGYRLSFVSVSPGDMKVVLSAKGITYSQAGE